MAFDGLLLAANLATGAVVGYLTNSLAIKMLFKEYPIIGGGEVIKNRDELEQAMSELVEEKLITPETLLEEFGTEGFKQSFEELIRYIIANNLKEHLLRFETPGELNGYQQTLANLKQFLRQKKEPILDASLTALFRHLTVQNILSSEQQKKILTEVWRLLLHTLDSHAEEIGLALKETLKGVKNDDFLPESMLLKLVSHWLKDLPQNLQEQGFIDLLDRFIEALSISDLLEQLEQRLRELNLSEILGEEPTRDTAQELALRLLHFFNTERGQRLLEDLLRQTLQQLKKLDLPLSLLMNETLERKLLELVERYLPTILKLLENWAEQNKLELENLVQEAIQEHLRSENVVKHMTATLFSEQISERYRIIENVLDEIKEIASQSLPELIEMFNRFLENTSIGEVVIYLEKHLLDYTALTRTLLRLFNTYLPRLDLTMLAPVFERPLGSFSILDQIHLAPIWEKIIYPYARTQIQERLLPVLPHWITGWVKEIWQTIRERPLNEWIPNQDFEAFIHRLLKTLKDKPFEAFILKQLLEELPKILAERTIEELLTPEVRKTLWIRLGQLYENRLDGFLDSFQIENMDRLYEQLMEIFFSLAENKDVARQIREVLVQFMIEMIRDNELFHRRIYQTVKMSFSRFSDREMEAEMESFMGQELKPITLFGAVLGAGVGGILSFLSMIPGSELYITGIPALFTFPLAYALTGIGTNWLAIKMLFRPYYARHWPFSKKSLPFTPGVFVKNKKALADSMSRFVDQKLLSKQNMVDILDQYHHRWKEVIKEVVSRNDYAAWNQRVQTAARENYDLLTPLLLDLAFEQIYRSRQDIALNLISEAREVHFQENDLEELKTDIHSILISSEPYLRRFINRRLEDWLQRNYPLSDQLSPPQAAWLYERLGGGLKHVFDSLLDLLQSSNRSKNVLKQLSQRWEHYLDLQLETVTPGATLPKKELVRYVLNWIQSEALQTEIRHLMQRYLGYLLQGKQTLGDIWEGKILILMRQESDVLIDILSSYLLELARQNKDRIAKAVVSDVQRQGVLEIMLVNFGGIRKDVYQVVDVVIEKKLDSFLASKADGIKSWWQDILHHHLPQLMLGDLGLDPELFEIETLQSILRDNVLDNPKTFTLLTDFTDAVVDELMIQLDFKSLLQSLQLYSLNDVIERFATEIEIARQHLAKALIQNEDFVRSKLMSLGKDMLDLQILERPPAEWLTDVSIVRAKHILARAIALVYHSPVMDSLLTRLLNQMLEPLKQGDISHFIDYAVLEQDVTRTMEQLTLATTPSSQAFQSTIRNQLKDITIQFIEVLNQHIAKDTKEDLENLAVDSLIDGLRINNRELLEPIDFEAIVHREVVKMNPERIESLFDFAQPVFKALIMYGALGGVIGILAGLLAALG